MVKRDTGLHLRSGCAAGFYHHGALTDSGCNYVPPRKVVFGRRPSWPELRDKGATGGNVLSEVGMLARIALGDTRSDHGDSPPAGLQGGAMSCRVNTAREARHHSDALSGEQTRHVRCPADTLIGGLTGTDYRHRSGVALGDPSAHEQEGWQIGDEAQIGWIVAVQHGCQMSAHTGCGVQFRVNPTLKRADVTQAFPQDRTRLYGCS